MLVSLKPGIPESRYTFHCLNLEENLNRTYKKYKHSIANGLARITVKRLPISAASINGKPVWQITVTQTTQEFRNA